MAKNMTKVKITVSEWKPIVVGPAVPPELLMTVLRSESAKGAAAGISSGAASVVVVFGVGPKLNPLMSECTQECPMCMVWKILVDWKID